MNLFSGLVLVGFFVDVSQSKLVSECVCLVSFIATWNVQQVILELFGWANGKTLSDFVSIDF